MKYNSPYTVQVIHTIERELHNVLQFANENTSTTTVIIHEKCKPDVALFSGVE